MADGIVALSSFQGGIESVRGTLVAATRKQGLNGWWVPNQDLHDVHEQRNTFTDVFRQFPVKSFAELRGLTNSPTFEDLPWFLGHAAQGGVSPVLSDTAAYTRTYAPTFNVDDLETVSWECANNFQDFAFPFALCDKLDLEFFADKAAVMTVDYLAQQAIAQARTTGLSDRATEDINGALGKAYIDGSVIGSTQVQNVIRAKFSLANNWRQLFNFNGFLYPGKAYRKTRSMAAEFDIVFDSLTEFNAFNAGTERKVRFHVDGTVIPGTTTKKSLDVDFYGKWRAFALSDQDGVIVAKVTSTSAFDTGASLDWRFAVVNGVAVLP